MTLRVGSRGYNLTREHQLSLPAGSYRLVFELKLVGYEARETRQVELDAGEQQTVRSPILQPGGLSLRARPGRPQARIQIDGQDAGMSPLSQLRRPGPCRLELRSGSGEPLLQEVTIRAGEETVLTFDLAAAEIAATQKPLTLR